VSIRAARFYGVDEKEHPVRVTTFAQDLRALRGIDTFVPIGRLSADEYAEDQRFFGRMSWKTS
jgi:hypothetical protein